MSRRTVTRRALAGLSLCLFAGIAGTPSRSRAAGDHVAAIDRIAPRLRALVATPAVIAAVQAQNQRHAGLTQADIDRLDAQWRKEVGAAAQPLIAPILASPLSAALKLIQSGSNGLITEIFVMDDKGLNVAQSEVTSDYWQGDEAKFKRSFGVGPDATFVDKVELDESTQEFQAQFSFTLIDPATRAPIGAATIGISIERLGE